MAETSYPRPITLQEAAVIRAIISRAPCSACLTLEKYRVDDLEVAARCECGCDSVFFSGYDPSKPPTIVADGLGYSESSDETNIILWANESRIVHLELVTHSESPARLPLPGTVCSFENQRR
jgi:hypothetical protein